VRRNFSEMNEQFAKVAEKIQPTESQWKEFERFAENYKDKDQKEIEAEMQKLLNSFSRKEKDDLIQKLKMLKQMDLLDNSQKMKVDMFIQLLSE
jgi:F0F1-type ATP synthase membrane subunit b/b'